MFAVMLVALLGADAEALAADAARFEAESMTPFQRGHTVVTSDENVSGGQALKWFDRAQADKTDVNFLVDATTLQVRARQPGNNSTQPAISGICKG